MFSFASPISIRHDTGIAIRLSIGIGLPIATGLPIIKKPEFIMMRENSLKKSARLLVLETHKKSGGESKTLAKSIK